MALTVCNSARIRPKKFWVFFSLVLGNCFQNAISKSFTSSKGQYCLYQCTLMLHLKNDEGRWLDKCTVQAILKVLYVGLTPSG